MSTSGRMRIMDFEKDGFVWRLKSYFVVATTD